MHLLVLVAVIGLLVMSAPSIISGVMGPVIREYYDRVKNQPLTEDKIAQIYEMSPIDEEGYEKIEALPSG